MQFSANRIEEPLDVCTAHATLAVFALAWSGWLVCGGCPPHERPFAGLLCPVFLPIPTTRLPHKIGSCHRLCSTCLCLLCDVWPVNSGSSGLSFVFNSKQHAQQSSRKTKGPEPPVNSSFPTKQHTVQPTQTSRLCRGGPRIIFQQCHLW